MGCDCVSQVSVAILYLTAQCSSLLQHCHGNDKLSQICTTISIVSVDQGRSCLPELPSWGSQGVCPKGRTMEKSWHWKNGAN